jgi:hypothetical protein
VFLKFTDGSAMAPPPFFCRESCSIHCS